MSLSFCKVFFFLHIEPFHSAPNSWSPPLRHQPIVYRHHLNVQSISCCVRVVSCHRFSAMQFCSRFMTLPGSVPFQKVWIVLNMIKWRNALSLVFNYKPIDSWNGPESGRINASTSTFRLRATYDSRCAINAPSAGCGRHLATTFRE